MIFSSDFLLTRSLPCSLHICEQEKKATNLREIETLSFEDAFSALLTFEKLDSYEGAVVSFQQAVKCEPKHLHALSHLAALPPFRHLEKHGQDTEAYEKAMDIHGHALQSAHQSERERWKAYVITLRVLAEAYGERSDLDSAVKVYEDAVIKFPDAANMHYSLATMRMARMKSSGDDTFEALMVQSLERTMELCPEMPEFVNDLVAYLEEHKQQLDQVCILKKKAEEMERKQEEEKERD
ncbi:hypothetical protein PsorP6_013684 [Peronosclerospora sorghi]|uniref:Uncharacterized protein n=1 Tax=Peronosclerospora sorghi TaxID=230839 RepID=A0ACC0VGF7_9STRA|nr:hypothetical protein PsorP6_013684 [Peronosclerospora sorghi]